ncbi:M20 family metallopeptidase [Saccharopolyspora sp. K220]|uniref:M20 family metallopeptidase n=1 Tax=Saccharopolyspora soli TaxID=2926618 RepID=UPI001F589CEF|nr:M20 family metallopeptidase [Saccharopolyspora soli]MCI2418815.1 M20 family metallopeptidase [Saccharopolyspora soli]
MTRDAAVERATRHFDSGAFRTDLARRVAFRTESQDPQRADVLRQYLLAEIIPAVEHLGCSARIVDNPVPGGGPFLLAHRHEDDALPTLLTYGHGDVVLGHDAQWRTGLDPWQLSIEGDRWYGRGTADNKGQHTINLAALEKVLDVRGGKLGFNLKVLLDMSEEIGSPGLGEVCAEHSDELAADLLIASDGCRLAAQRPTLFLGSRGAVNFALRLKLRDGAHHSGNWGGLLRNPASVLANALASMVSDQGKLLVDGLRPPAIPDSVREALSDVTVDGGPDSPTIDADWGEPGLTPSERVYGWNTLEVLAFTAGTPQAPVNAIPGSAEAHCQLRFVVGTDWRNVEQIVRKHLDDRGFSMIEIEMRSSVAATRLDPENEWVRWALDSLRRTTGVKPALLPNLGGTLPNDAFAEVLGLPTIWVPHSYPACAQHGPDEHLLGSVAREALRIMAGLFWDLGDVAQTRR